MLQAGQSAPGFELPDADMEMTTQIVADSAFGWNEALYRAWYGGSAVRAEADIRRPFRQQYRHDRQHRENGHCHCE